MNQANLLSLLFELLSMLSLAYGSPLKGAPSPTMFSSGSHIGGPISSSSGYSGLIAAQQGTAGQSLSFAATGDDLVLTLVSEVLADGFTSNGQSGGNSGDGTAGVNDSTATSEILPQSTIEIGLSGADSVTLELGNVAEGSEQVDSVVEQQAQVTQLQDGGWEASSNGGWGSPTNAPVGWGAALQN